MRNATVDDEADPKKRHILEKAILCWRDGGDIYDLLSEEELQEFDRFVKRLVRFVHRLMRRVDPIAEDIVNEVLVSFYSDPDGFILKVKNWESFTYGYVRNKARENFKSQKREGFTVSIEDFGQDGKTFEIQDPRPTPEAEAIKKKEVAIQARIDVARKFCDFLFETAKHRASEDFRPESRRDNGGYRKFLEKYLDALHQGQKPSLRGLHKVVKNEMAPQKPHAFTSFLSWMRHDAGVFVKRNPESREMIEEVIGRDLLSVEHRRNP